MTRHSPHTVTYKDLLKWTEKQLGYAKQRRSTAPGRGVTNLEALSHDIACAEKLERMLKQCEPGKQADLFELFNQVNR